MLRMLVAAVAAPAKERSLRSLRTLLLLLLPLLLLLVLSSRGGDSEHGCRGRAGLAPLGRRRRPGHGGRNRPREESKRERSKRAR